MAKRSFESLRSEYASLWGSCQIKPKYQDATTRVARQIMGNRAAYERVSARTGVPWFVIGIMHAMECDEFPKRTQHLHNGDPLDRKTRLVPAGRPAVWPPADGADKFEASAVDALTMPGKQFDKIKDWSIERIAYVLETYNGWGYRSKGVNSAYLWSFTNHYGGGKYVRDHVWSSTAVSTQCGGMALLKVLYELDSGLTSTQPVAAAATERAWPKADVVKPPAIATARESKTVKALLLGVVATIMQWVEKTFDFLPSVVSDATDMLSPITSLFGMLKVNMASVATGVTVVCLVIAITRHTKDKGELNTLKEGDDDA